MRKTLEKNNKKNDSRKNFFKRFKLVMLAIITIYKIKEGKMEEALAISRELIQHVRNSDPGLLDMFAYTVKGRKHRNEIVFVENYSDGEALNRITANAQDLEPYRKLSQYFVGVDVLRCDSID